jgi:hypothetical protein
MLMERGADISVGTHDKLGLVKKLSMKNEEEQMQELLQQNPNVLVTILSSIGSVGYIR